MPDQPTALDLPMVDPLPEATQKYFDICQEKLGMVPNVLRAYAFDIEKLNVCNVIIGRTVDVAWRLAARS